MTGWASALQAARGVVTWAYDVPLTDLEETAAEDGCRFVLLDSSETDGKTGFLDACELAFDLPDWFGRNWDALEEALADLPVDKGTIVAWVGWEPLEQADPEAYATAVDVFDSTARRHAADGARFAVLRLEGERS